MPGEYTGCIFRSPWIPRFLLHLSDKTTPWVGDPREASSILVLNLLIPSDLSDIICAQISKLIILP